MDKIEIKENKYRRIYDITNSDEFSYKSSAGLTEEIIKAISANKGEPDWMLRFRLNCLDVYNAFSLPNWGPDISELDMDKIVTYVRPISDMSDNWQQVPKDIRDTFDRLGIQDAERESLAGVGAQYDSEVVYHRISKSLKDKGVIYTDIENAVKEYPIVKKYFMKLVPPSDHKFSALHGAVWSGGSFVYVPANVSVEFPLQSYFRLNSPGAGQFEHTLIILESGSQLHFIEGCSAPKYDVTNLHAGCVELFVGKGASLHYSTIENWSKNMLNLNTKRCLVEEDGKITWVSGSFGSKVSMLYPMSILKGDRAKCEFTAITFAGSGQVLDTGAKIIHAAPFTQSVINTKSISRDGGKAIYRGMVNIEKDAINARSSINCESLMMDNMSSSDTVPFIRVKNQYADIGHEAKIGKISDDVIYYMMSRGIDENEARSMIIMGFAEPVSKELPLEYAVEMNNLINAEFVGSIG